MSSENEKYNPFIRGPYPVGVLTKILTDSSRKRF